MHYYQYDALLRDGIRQEHVSYVLKSPTLFKGKDIQECLQFQHQYLTTVLKFDELQVGKLSFISESQAEWIVKQNGMSIKSIPSVEFCEMASGLQDTPEKEAHHETSQTDSQDKAGAK
jgi:hypothetical protein